MGGVKNRELRAMMEDTLAVLYLFLSSRRRHTILQGDWSSDVCSSDLAVYQNRLQRRMRLEADPTVSYAYGRRLKRVWEKNLAVRSAYNTYLHAGLPPGPIG